MQRHRLSSNLVILRLCFCCVLSLGRMIQQSCHLKHWFQWRDEPGAVTAAGPPKAKPVSVTSVEMGVPFGVPDGVAAACTCPATSLTGHPWIPQQQKAVTSQLAREVLSESGWLTLAASPAASASARAFRAALAAAFAEAAAAAPTSFFPRLSGNPSLTVMLHTSPCRIPSVGGNRWSERR